MKSEQSGTRSFIRSPGGGTLVQRGSARETSPIISEDYIGHMLAFSKNGLTPESVNA